MGNSTEESRKTKDGQKAQAIMERYVNSGVPAQDILPVEEEVLRQERIAREEYHEFLKKVKRKKKISKRNQEKLELLETQWLDVKRILGNVQEFGVRENVDMNTCLRLAEDRNLGLRRVGGFAKAKKARYEGLEKDTKDRFEFEKEGFLGY